LFDGGYDLLLLMVFHVPKRESFAASLEDLERNRLARGMVGLQLLDQQDRRIVDQISQRYQCGERVLIGLLGGQPTFPLPAKDLLAPCFPEAGNRTDAGA